jgi:hypothetical protein
MREIILGATFAEFIDELIVKSPCTFEIRHPNAVRSFGPGWAYQRADLLRRALDQRFPEGSIDGNIFDPKKQKEAESRKRKLDEIRNMASSKMDLFGPIEQALPGDMGSLRVHLPYFNLKDGPSILFFKIVDDLIYPLDQEEDDDDETENELGREAATITRESWRGFSTSVGSTKMPRNTKRQYRPILMTNFPVIVELDIVDHATISIDRNSLVLDGEKDVRRVVRETCLSLFENFARHQKSSPYVEATVELLRDNEFELPPDLKGLSGLYWIFPANPKEDIFVWRPIAFPAILNLDGSSRSDRLLNGRLDTARAYKDEIRGFDLDSNASIEPLGVLAPARILLCKRRRKLRIALLYETGSDFRVDRRLIAEFPEEWAHVIAIKYNSQTIYNRNCSLNRRMSSNGWQELKSVQSNRVLHSDVLPSMSPADTRLELLSRVAQSNSEVASAFILYYCDMLDCEDWNSLRAADLKSWQAVFQLAGFGSSSDFVVFWQYDGEDDDGLLLRLSVDGATKLKGHVSPGGHPCLPIPSEQWWLDGDNRNGIRRGMTGAKRN